MWSSVKNGRRKLVTGISTILIAAISRLGAVTLLGSRAVATPSWLVHFMNEL